MIEKKFLSIVLLIIVVSTLMAGFPSVTYPLVTLDVRDGSGVPGKSDNPVEVSLENLNDKVKGVSVDICDVGNYLSCAGCQATARTPGFSCSTNELANGCVRVLLFSTLGNLIEEGSGPIFTLKYEVSGGAPSAGCKNLNPEGVSIANENGSPFPSELVTSVSGNFCFLSCTTDQDCNDGLFCNGEETCDVGSGNCQDGTYPCQTPPNYSCEEETNQCLPGLAPVFLAVGDGLGVPDSSGNLVEVSLQNFNDKVKGVSMEICDGGNYLSCTGCEATARTPGFSCSTNELDDGCVRVLLFSTQGNTIAEGSGPIFTLTYEVSGAAPEGGCKDLAPGEMSVAGEDGDPLQAPVILESGQFCFLGCVSNQDCNDGLFCNGEETCDLGSGNCQDGTYPCQIPPNYSCEEETNQCLPGPAPVFIIVEDSAGLPGSSGNQVDVLLQNIADKVKGTSMVLCDIDNYLNCRACNSTARTPGFSCSTNELANGCVRVLLFSTQGNIIEEGSGPIFTLTYEVSGAAPEGECRHLNPKEVSVAGEDGDPLQAPMIVDSGKFCFFYCASDPDCTDGLFCNGVETCVSGYCQSGINPCPDDDGIFCNGVESCDEVNYCTHSGNPCPPPLSCNEAEDGCNCSQDEDCDDDLFCNGGETCVNAICQPGTNPCPETACNTCQEDTDSCYDPEGTSCNDSLYCNGDDTCDGQGNCVHSGDPCPPGATCNEIENVCTCSQDADCDDSLFCNGEESCEDGICDIKFSYLVDYPCKDCYGYDDCDCNEGNDTCQPVTLIVGEGSGYRGSTGNPVEVSLVTLYSKVKTVTMDVCDVDNYLSCTECVVTARATDFMCLTNELDNGCCRVVLFPIGGVIKSGQGAVLTVKYNVSSSAPSECTDLNPGNISVGNEYNMPLYVHSVSGEFCFYNCSSAQDCDDSTICTDDVCDGTGVCVYSHNNDPCDDGLFCNGDDTCSNGSCSAHSGSPCPPEYKCNEATDSCDLKALSTPLPTIKKINEGEHINFLKNSRGTGLLAEGGWTIERVDTIDNVGLHTCLALDENSNPHISYYGSGNLKYAYYNGSSWHSETVDSVLVWNTSLALDKSGNPHICYFDWLSYNLKYAYYDGSWHKETVDNISAGVGGISLVLDKNDTPHICYYDWSNGDLKYTYYNGSWHTETVDNVSNLLGNTSLALDKNGNPHFSYYDWVKGDLKYAFYYITVDSSGDVGWYTSLALDENDNPHISYYDNTNGNLKYAYYYNGWYTITVDYGDDVGRYTSLALDNSDNPHISYYDNSNGDLKYAYYDGSWHREIIDSNGDVGWYTFLALDKNGSPHISYYDSTNGDLKYTFKLTGNDSDSDAVLNNVDNCPNHPNGPALGTCICGGNSCMSDGECEYGSCSMNQEDTNNDDVGDVCDQSLCRAYLCRYENCVELQAASRNVDYSACRALTNQGKSVCEAAGCYWNPQGLPNGACVIDICLSNADFNSAIDGLDLAVYKKELFRVDCP